mgnify:CR=1 FL=1
MERKRKLTSMIWRSVLESLAFGIILAGGIIYFLRYYGYLGAFGGLLETITAMSAVTGIAVIGGIAFGVYQGGRLRRRLDAIRDSMLFLEKGNLSKPIPDLGDDELGQLAEQLGRISRKWEEQVTSLQRLSTHNAELAEKARFTAVIEERQRLARELHDAVSQQLFAISMTATALGRTMDKDFEKAKRHVALIEEMAAVAQSEVRALLLHLRPVHLEGKKLADGLDDLLRELKAKVPIEIAADIDRDIELTKGIEDHLFRIVQEALSNTLRHSKATKLSVSLKEREGAVHLTVRDNGIGFDPGQKKHASYGIASMQERVNELGGAMQIISAEGKGTRVDIRIPIVEREGETANVDGRAH